MIFNANANIPYDIVIATLRRHAAVGGRQDAVPGRRLRRGDPLMADAETPEDVRASQGKKAIRSYARKLAEPEVIKDLNITPMMDMMTIILVFLLK